MQISNTNQNFSSDDPVWVLLAELPLVDFLSDQDRRDGLAAGFLFQTAQELGMSPECMENIARTLAGFAKEASVRTEQGRPEFPGWMRIFCQKRLIEAANSEKPSRASQAELGKEQKQIFPGSGIGGWGYFSIERAGNLFTGSSLSAGNSVDVYLYKEGE